MSSLRRLPLRTPALAPLRTWGYAAAATAVFGFWPVGAANGATASLAVTAAGPSPVASVSDGPRELLGPRVPLTVTPGANGWLSLQTAPARRASDSVGMNLDAWSHAGGYADGKWHNIFSSLKASGIRAVRTDIHLVNGTWGTERQVQMGKAGIKLDVTLGDAFDRYSATPFDKVYDVFQKNLLPYAEAVEGSNEPDLAGRADWVPVARAHQQKIVDAVNATPGAANLAVFAPPTGRVESAAQLGSMVGLADYGNAHAYSGGRNADLGFDRLVPPAAALLPTGAAVVTEAGVHTQPENASPHKGVSEAVAARYVPKVALEGIRRGLPRTYLFDFVDRFDDPDKNRVEAHFGLLRVDGSKKPAYKAVSRLMSELRDPKGNVAARPAAVSIRPSAPLPSDVRMVALRHADGSLVLALWRERLLWDISKGTPIATPTTSVHLALGERYLAARVRNLNGASTTWQYPFMNGLSVKLGDDVTMVRLTGRF